MAIPNWLKLIRAWRKKRRSGLTLEFLCAACGMQSQDLLYQMYMRQIPVCYCFLIDAPLSGWGEGLRFTISLDVKDYLFDWLQQLDDDRKDWTLSDDEVYNLLIDFVHAQLAEGRPSRSKVQFDEGGYNRWNYYYQNTPFTKEDKAFIKRVLGHNPPEITGVGRTGRIQYRKCYS